MVPWIHENIVWKRWRVLIIGAKSSSQDPIDEHLWMVLLYYTQLYSEFSWKINQINWSIHTKLGTLLAWISFSQGIHHSKISYPRLPSIHQSIYVWFCICSSCWQYVSDFQYHDCYGLYAGRSVDSLLKQQWYSCGAISKNLQRNYMRPRYQLES